MGIRDFILKISKLSLENTDTNSRHTYFLLEVRNLTIGLTAIQWVAQTVVSGATEALSGREEQKKTPQKATTEGSSSLFKQAYDLLALNTPQEKGSLDLFTLLDAAVQQKHLDLDRLDEKQCEDVKHLVRCLVEEAVQETIRMFNLPIKHRMPSGSPYFWRQRPQKLVDRAEKMLERSHKIFAADELKLLRLDLQRARALLSPGLAQGSDLAIKRLKCLKKGLSTEELRDPRFKNILDHADLHLKKIYDRRRMEGRYQSEQFAENIQPWLDPEFRGRVWEKLQLEWETITEFYKENPQILAAEQYREVYQKTMESIEKRAVEYVLTRSRYANEPVIIEGWIDFSELPDELKKWEEKTRDQVNQALLQLSEQLDNPELEDEIVTMRANLQLASALFREQPLQALRKFRKDLGDQAKAELDSSYDEPLRRADQLLWKIFDGMNLDHKVDEGKNFYTLLKARAKKEGFKKIEANLSAQTEWDQQGIALLDQCLQDELCVTEGIRHIYRETVKTVQPWIGVADRSDNPDYLKTKPWKLLMDAKDLLTAHVLNPHLGKEQVLMQFNLERIDKLLLTPAHKVLDKLASIKKGIEANSFPEEIIDLFSGQLVVDIMRQRLEAASTPEWKVSFLEAELILKDEKYDMAKVHQVLQDTALIAENSSYEKAAKIYLGIAEYAMLKMNDTDILRGSGLQALIKLFREYPDSEAAQTARQMPVLQPLIQRIHVRGRVPEYLHASDLTDDDWREEFKVLTDHGIRNTGARKAAWVTLSAGALLTSAVVFKRVNPKDVLTLGVATEEVTMAIAYGLVLGGVGLDTIVPALNHRAEAKKARVLPIYQVDERRHAENLDIFWRTAMYFPAFMTSRATIQNSKLLYGLVGNSMKTQRAQLALTGLALPYHTESSNAISRLISGQRFAVERNYSLINVAGFAASSFLPLAIKDSINRNPTVARVLFIDAKKKGVQEIHAFGYAGAVINLAWHGANYVHHQEGHSDDIEYPYPTSAGGFWAMEARDMTLKKVDLSNPIFWSEPSRYRLPENSRGLSFPSRIPPRSAPRNRGMWRGLGIR